MSESKMHHFTVEESFQKKRLDGWLAEMLSEEPISRSYIQQLIKEGHLTKEGVEILSPSTKIKADEQYSLTIPAPKILETLPQNIPLEILYEDEAIIIINKQAGLSVHPSSPEPDGTLVNALLYHTKDLSGINGVLRPGIVHRLDKHTSGLLVVAKSNQAHIALKAQFEDKSIQRIYHAFVWGMVSPTAGTYYGAIGRHPTQRIKMAVVNKNGKEATTHYSTLKHYGSVITEIECKLETGRTHQIRVHCSAHNHPLLGDPLYGRNRNQVQKLLTALPGASEHSAKILALNRQALHAKALSLIHPISKEKMHFTSSLPEDLKMLQHHLQKLIANPI